MISEINEYNTNYNDDGAVLDEKTIAVITKIREEFEKKTILVIGDLMVDQYVTGSVGRISPEAPVPILNYSERSLKCGGACNVAKNIKALGCNVLIAGVTGDDEAGRWMRSHLKEAGIETECVIEEPGRPTTLKTRYATKGQQLLRVDNEKTDEILPATKKEIFHYIELNAKRIDGVIISDYQKGVFNSTGFIRDIIEQCRNNNIIIAIDSKSRNISAFENADIVKPNNIELENAVNVKINDVESLNKAGEMYLSKSKSKVLLVTRGPKGISVFREGKKREDYAAAEAQVYDVTGAGDTVISTVVVSLLSDMTIEESVKLANIAAGIVISKVGTVAISREELIERVSCG